MNAVAPTPGTQTKPIEQVRPGDLVWAWDPVLERTVPRSVRRLFRHAGKPITALHIESASGELEVIEATLEHPFWVEARGGWVAASQLRAGDQLRCIVGDARSAMVVRVSRVERPVPVYNFEVADNHNYFVGSAGCLVHNESSRSASLPEPGTGPRSPQADMRDAERNVPEPVITWNDDHIVVNFVHPDSGYGIMGREYGPGLPQRVNADNIGRLREDGTVVASNEAAQAAPGRMYVVFHGHLEGEGLLTGVLDGTPGQGVTMAELVAGVRRAKDSFGKPVEELVVLSCGAGRLTRNSPVHDGKQQTTAQHLHDAIQPTQVTTAYTGLVDLVTLGTMSAPHNRHLGAPFPMSFRPEALNAPSEHTQIPADPMVNYEAPWSDVGPRPERRSWLEIRDDLARVHHHSSYSRKALDSGPWPGMETGERYALERAFNQAEFAPMARYVDTRRWQDESGHDLREFVPGGEFGSQVRFAELPELWQSATLINALYHVRGTRLHFLSSAPDHLLAIESDYDIKLDIKDIEISTKDARPRFDFNGVPLEIRWLERQANAEFESFATRLQIQASRFDPESGSGIQIEPQLRSMQLRRAGERVAAGALRVLDGQITSYLPIGKKGLFRSYGHVKGGVNPRGEARSLGTGNPWGNVYSFIAGVREPEVAHEALAISMRSKPDAYQTIYRSGARDIFVDDARYLLEDPLASTIVGPELKRMARADSYLQMLLNQAPAPMRIPTLYGVPPVIKLLP